MPIVFIEPIVKRYRTEFESSAFCFTICFILIGLIAPFFLVFGNEKFWSIPKFAHDQPIVEYTNQMLMSVRDNNSMYFYSSMNNIEEIYKDYNTLNPIIKYTSEDTNNDQKVDSFNFTIAFNANTETTTDIKLILIFDYSFINDELTKYYTPVMLYLHLNSKLGISEAKTIGSLKLKQKYPISQSTRKAYTLDKSVFNDNTVPKDFMSVYEHFRYKNITTKYDYEKFIYPYKSSDTVSIELFVDIPKLQEFNYYSDALYSLKECWLKYFYTFFPMIVILYLILQFAYRSKIFKTVVTIDNENERQRGDKVYSGVRSVS